MAKSGYNFKSKLYLKKKGKQREYPTEKKHLSYLKPKVLTNHKCDSPVTNISLFSSFHILSYFFSPPQEIHCKITAFRQTAFLVVFKVNVSFFPAAIIHAENHNLELTQYSFFLLYKVLFNELRVEE